MGIRVTCPNGHSLNVKEHLAGRVGRCPNCGSPVRIPAATPTPSSAGQAAAEAPPAPSAAAPIPPTPPAVSPSPAVSPPPTAGPVVVVAEEPLLARSGVVRDPRRVAQLRARQRRMALVALSVLSVALAALLAWVLLGK